MGILIFHAESRYRRRNNIPGITSQIWSLMKTGKVNELKAVFFSILENKLALTTHSLTSITGIELETVKRVLEIHLDRWLEELTGINHTQAYTEPEQINNHFTSREYAQYLIIQHQKTYEILIINKNSISTSIEKVVDNDAILHILSLKKLFANLGIYNDNLIFGGTALLLGPLQSWLLELVLYEYHMNDKLTLQLDKIDIDENTMVILSDPKKFLKVFLESLQLNLVESGQQNAWYSNTDRTIINLVKQRSKISSSEIKDFGLSAYFIIGRLLLSNVEDILNDDHHIELLSDTQNHQNFLLFEQQLQKLIETIEIKHFNNTQKDMWVDISQYIPEYHSLNPYLQIRLKEKLENFGHSLLKNGRMVLSFSTGKSRNIELKPETTAIQKKENIKEEKHVQIPEKIDTAAKSSFIPIQSSRVENSADMLLNVGLSNMPLQSKDEDRSAKLKSRDGIFKGILICDGVTNSGNSNDAKVGGKEAADLAKQTFDEIISNLEASNIRENFEEIVDVGVHRVTKDLADRKSQSKTTFILLISDGLKVYIAYLGDGSIIQLRSDGISSSSHHLFAHKASSRHLSGFLSKNVPLRKPMVMIHSNPFAEEGIFYVVASDGMGFPSGKLPKLFAGQVIRSLVKYFKLLKVNKNRTPKEVTNKIQKLLDTFLAGLSPEDIKDDTTVGILHIISRKSVLGA